MPGITKKQIILLWLLFTSLTLSAQNRFTLAGKVIDNETSEQVEFVAIQIKELERWTTSDNKGAFSFQDIPAGTYTIEASCLGFEFFTKQVSFDNNVSDITINLVKSSLALEEVTVVAKENTALSSSSVIESAALEHVQPTNLADVMQLVPGQITVNPDMSKSNQISIRDINSSTSPNDNSAMGTSIVVDGTPMSNGANMQSVSTVSNGSSQGYSTAGQGIDLRQISTDNIESVEVIRGIPSVQYGDLTTGAVLVKTKAGKSNWNVKLKADPLIKQTALSKGFLLPWNNTGVVNIDLDYTYAYDDPRKPTSSYKRVTTQLSYSNTFFKESTPLSFHFKGNYYSTFDNQKTDPDMVGDEVIKSKEKNAGFKLYGNWLIKKSWLNNVSYNFSGDFTNQDYYEYKANSASTTPIPTALVSGESIGSILPSNYYSELTVEGRPFNYFAVIKTNTNLKYRKISNNILTGVEWRSSGNNGKGRIYDLSLPPSESLLTRPRAFSDIPDLRELSLFAEDKITIPIGSTSLQTQAGIRFSNMLPSGLFSTDGFTTLEPRINLKYDLINNKKTSLLSDLTFRLGYGETSKTPGMIFLYPDKAYLDEISFNYYPDLMVISTTVIDDTSNPDLKPTTNTKFEAGVDFKIKGVNVMITGFYEKLRDGFSWENTFFTMDYKKWGALSETATNPVYSNGEITYTDAGENKTLAYSTAREFQSYQTPTNNCNIDKKGLEYVINFGKIPAINSTLIVDGAYYHIEETNDVHSYTEKISYSYQGERFPFLAVFPGNKGKIKQRLNTNIKLNMHIPSLRMVSSVTGMIVWFDKYNYFWKDENDHNIAYWVDDNNERVYGNYDQASKIAVDPIGYYDKDMTFHPWQNELSSESPYIFMVDEYRYDYFFSTEKPITWQINIKLTKELGDRATFSFFANNLFNNRPLYKYPRTDSYTRLNQSAYFGAELKLIL